MIKYFSKAFRVTNDNIILATPLVLFLFILSIYLGVAKNAPATIPTYILLILTTFFMVSAFLAGWFFMVKRAIDLDKIDFIIDEDKARASFGLMRELTLGVGEYFLSFAFGLILYIGLMVLVIFLAYQAGIHFIGKVDIDVLALKMAFSSQESLKSLVHSLTKEQLFRLNLWNLLIIGTTSFFSFITMFWPAHVIIKNKNSFIAFFQSFKFLIRNLLSSIILFVYISIVNFMVSLLNAISAVHPIVYFISMLAYFYFVVYVVVLVFLYYDSENNPKFEYRIDDSFIAKADNSSNSSSNNSDYRADSDRQEHSGDSDSEGE